MMFSRKLLLAVGFGMATFVGVTGLNAVNPPEELSDTAVAQIRALQQEKTSRSAGHQKLDSHFSFQLKRNRNQISDPVLTSVESQLEFQPDGRLLVDIDAEVTDDLLAEIRQAGGTIRSSVPRFHSIRALLDLGQLESLAARGDVKFVKRAVKGHHRVDSQGDTTHGANLARSQFGVNGSGVNVGVLSDSVDSLSTLQSSGDLGPVTVLPGQDGTGTGEGTAMLEIVYNLAPGAGLFFATAGISEASFAQNILDLRSAGCDIIVDDFGYFDESPFQDGPVAQAVNSVTASGALYFSAAGNDGNQDDGTSSTWEGDFVDGGAVTSPISADDPTGNVHKFGANNYAVVTGTGAEAVLFWSDPLGAASDDYDLFVLNSTGSRVRAFSNNTQNGTQDPYESCAAGSSGSRIVVVKFSGAARFLHVSALSDGNSVLSPSTSGNMNGHQCANDAFCMAAADANTAYPNLFTTANVVETFTSDGPRHVFFNQDGSAITPGNFSSTGGSNRQKPDLTAADGTSSDVPGFTPFYGTSAAAPHAAAIAALLKSFKPGLTPSQIRQALTGTSLDIMSPGWDRDSGAGIVMAVPALQSVQLAAPTLSVSASHGIVTLSWNAVSGHTYQPQYSTSSSFTVWNNLGSALAGNNGTVTANDAVGPGQQRFYRLLVQ